MKLDAGDISDLKPLIAAAVLAVLDHVRANEAVLGERFAYPEPEAAALIGVQRHVLRDARLRGEIIGAKVGSKIVIERGELLRFLAARRLER